MYFAGKPGRLAFVLDTLEPPGSVTVPCPVEDLIGTARSIGLLAARAGYEVRARRSEPDTGALDVGGRMLGWAFHARHTSSGTWDVTIRRPGWPEALGDVTQLRRMLASQTPTDIGKASRGRR